MIISDYEGSLLMQSDVKHKITKPINVGQITKYATAFSYN